MDTTGTESSGEKQQEGSGTPQRPAAHLDEKIIIIAFIFGAFIGGAAGYLFLSKSAAAAKTADGAQLGFISQNDAAKVIEEYINKNIARKGDVVRVEGTEEISGIYKFGIKINSSALNQILTADIYSTKDGELLILSALNTSLAPPREGAADEEKTAIEKIADDDAVRGSPNASVIIVEFSDFQCPFCAKAYPTVKKVLEAYAGKVKLIYRDFPISSIHPFAQKAAEASECAEEQGKYWEYHDKLFETQQEWAEKGIPLFKIYAEELGLDLQKFSSCFDGGKYTEEVLKDLSDGQSLGITGTPTFFINGKALVGAQSFEAFQKAVEEELGKAE